jgi:hypothetical protein
VLGAFNRTDRRAVSHHVRMAVGKHQDVARHKGDAARVVLEAHVTGPLGDEVKDDHVLRLDREIGGHRAGVRLARAPGRGEFAVKEHGAVELHSPQDLGQHIHAGLLVERPAVGPQVRSRH